MDPANASETAFSPSYKGNKDSSDPHEFRKSRFSYPQDHARSAGAFMPTQLPCRELLLKSAEHPADRLSMARQRATLESF